MINAESSLGSLGSKLKWTFNKCYSEAIKYNTKKDFRENCPGAYYASKKYHYMEKFTWFVSPLQIWNYKKTYDEARKYNTSQEFQKNAPGAYSAASKNNWLKDYIWLNLEKRPSPKRIWDYKKTYAEAKKYTKMIDFRKKSPKAYNAAVKYQWIKDYTWLKRNANSNRIKKWNYQTTYDEAKKYSTIKDFRENSSSAYTTALCKGWLKDYVWLERMCEKNNTWTKERCYEEAKKYEYLKDFRNYSVSAYSAAQRNKWLKDYSWLKRKKK